MRSVSSLDSLKLVYGPECYCNSVTGTDRMKSLPAWCGLRFWGTLALLLAEFLLLLSMGSTQGDCRVGSGIWGTILTSWMPCWHRQKVNFDRRNIYGLAWYFHIFLPSGLYEFRFPSDCLIAELWVQFLPMHPGSRIKKRHLLRPDYLVTLLELQRLISISVNLSLLSRIRESGYSSSAGRFIQLGLQGFRSTSPPS